MLLKGSSKELHLQSRNKMKHWIYWKSDYWSRDTNCWMDKEKRMLWVKNYLKTACTSWHVMKEIFSWVRLNEWLTDNLILASQKVLREQTSISGFQDPILGEKMAFSIMKENFIQMLHDGYVHWLTVSTIGAQASNEVLIYDSMLHSLGGHGRKQVAALVACQEKEISIKMMKVQQQEGENDCGLFAIALATALSKGVQTGHSVFKQSEMRKHLLTLWASIRVTSLIASYVFKYGYPRCSLLVAFRAAAMYRDMRYIAIFFIYRDMRYIAIFFGHIAIQTYMDIRR